MKDIRYYSIKILAKLKLVKYFNFVIAKTINDKIVKIPFRGNVGLGNLSLSSNWLDKLLSEFIIHQQEDSKTHTKVFLDVGINIGQTLLRVKTLFPNLKYLGFDPNVTCVSYTQRLINLNKFTNCTVLPAALSSKQQILELEKDSMTDSRASIVSEFRPNVFSNKERVLAISFQGFAIENEVEILKVDVEGSELEVLQGMEKTILKYKPLIICEVLDSHSNNELNFTQNRSNQLFEMISSWNYCVVQLETNEKSIVNFKKIDGFNIKPWTLDSLKTNDYLFYPINDENEVFKKLNLLTGD